MVASIFSKALGTKTNKRSSTVLACLSDGMGAGQRAVPAAFFQLPDLLYDRLWGPPGGLLRAPSAPSSGHVLRWPVCLLARHDPPLLRLTYGGETLFVSCRQDWDLEMDFTAGFYVRITCK